MKKNIDIKNILYKIGCRKIAFDLWGLFISFDQLSKEQIKEIKNNTNKATEEEKEIIKDYINKWCENARCYSLIIK